MHKRKKAATYLRLIELVGIPLASEHNGTFHRIHNSSLRGLQYRELRPLQCEIVFSLEVLFHRYIRDDFTGLSLLEVKLVLTGVLFGDPEDFERLPRDT